MTEKFEVLTDREHALKRPGMYLGSITLEPVCGIIDYQYREVKVVPALIKMVEEIYQNSIDEHIRTRGEFVTKISVDIQNTITGTEIKISDDGRGIPVEALNGSYRPVFAWTELRAGSNFNDDSGRVTAGANGVGSSLVNIFSTKFVGWTCDGKKSLTLTCADNMSKIEYSIRAATKNRGVTVEFHPDLERFGLQEFDADHMTLIRDRLTNLSIIYPQIQFTFNGEKMRYKALKQEARKFHQDAICIDLENDLMRSSVVIAPSGAAEEFRCLSYVNGIYIKNGGSHIDFLLSKITDTLREFVKKKHKVDVLPNQVRQHLLIASWLNGFKNLKFDSQTKERITNTQSEVSQFYKDTGMLDQVEKLCKQILNTPAIIDPMIAAILYKKELAEKQALAKANKDLDKANLRKITKFTDATEKNRDECMLFICEGLSAASSILSVRTKNVAVYPLKGKILNALAADTKTLLANQEIVDLMAIIGLKIGEPAKNIRFGKIVVATDQDQDGAHIFGLLIALFRKYWSNLVTENRLYRFQTPIMKIMVDKREILCYNKQEFETWIAKNPGKKYQTRYLKGLGSSTAKDFAKYFEELDKNLIQLMYNSKDDFNLVDLVFGKDAGAADHRKQWLALEQ